MIRSKLHSNFIFVSFLFLIPYLLFKGLNFFYYVSIFLFTFYLIIKINILKQLIILNKQVFLFYKLFLIFLLLSIFYSPLISHSVDIFLTRYIFGTIIMLSLAVYFYNLHDLRKNSKIIFSYLVIVYFLFVSYLFIYSYLYLSFDNFLYKGFELVIHIENGFIRAHGSLNITAVLSLFFFVFLFLYAINTKIVYKFFFLSATFFSFILLLWLGRRAGILGISISLIILVILHFIKKKSFNYELILLFGLIFFILSIFIIDGKLRYNFFIRSDNLNTLYYEFHKQEVPQSSMGLRLFEWKRSLEKIKESPFVGTGLGRKVAKMVLYKDSPIGHPHNTFISLAVQSGIQTVLSFFIFFFYLVYQSIKVYFNFNKDFDNFRSSLLMVSFLYCICWFFIANFAGLEEKIGFIPFWIASGILLGLISHNK